MAGHSKWANIKHRKARQDAKRGKIYTKLIRELTVAAKEGDEPNDNPRLRLALERANSENMPKDTIKRAIERGAGKGEASNLEEVIYEGYGPGGVAILIEAMTDNRNRTVAEIRHAFTKFGGNLGENGSVSWMFEKLGQIIVESESTNEENLFNDALEAGADDFNREEVDFIISTNPTLTAEIAENLEKKGYSVVSSKVEMVPKNIIEVPESNSSKLINLMEKLEEHDDVQNIASNFQLTSHS